MYAYCQDLAEAVLTDHLASHRDRGQRSVHLRQAVPDLTDLPALASGSCVATWLLDRANTKDTKEPLSSSSPTFKLQVGLASRSSLSASVLFGLLRHRYLSFRSQARDSGPVVCRRRFASSSSARRLYLCLFELLSRPSGPTFSAMQPLDDVSNTVRVVLTLRSTSTAVSNQQAQ